MQQYKDFFRKTKLFFIAYFSTFFLAIFELSFYILIIYFSNVTMIHEPIAKRFHRGFALS